MDQEQQIKSEAPVEEEVQQIVQVPVPVEQQIEIQVEKPKAVVPHLPEAAQTQASMGTILSEQLKVLSPKSPEE